MHPEPENCHTPRRISRALVLCYANLDYVSISLTENDTTPSMGSEIKKYNHYHLLYYFFQCTDHRRGVKPATQWCSHRTLVMSPVHWQRATPSHLQAGALGISRSSEVKRSTSLYMISQVSSGPLLILSDFQLMTYCNKNHQDNFKLVIQQCLSTVISLISQVTFFVDMFMSFIITSHSTDINYQELKVTKNVPNKLSFCSLCLQLHHHLQKRRQYVWYMLWSGSLPQVQR